MTDENITNLLLTKFFASPKANQTKLLKFVFSSINQKDYLVDTLDNKKLTCNDKNFKEGDDILIDINISIYPPIDKKYYQDNALILKDLYIRVQVVHINPINGYIALKVMTSGQTEVSTVEISSYHILNQLQIRLV